MRETVGKAAASLAYMIGLVAAIGALSSWLGQWSGWADAASHFSAIWFVFGLISAFALLFAPKRRSRLIVGLATAVIAATKLASAHPPQISPNATGEALRLLTLNAWSGNQHAREAASDIIRLGADIVIIQEADGLRRDGGMLAKAYPYELTCHAAAYCRLRVFSRYPIAWAFEYTPQSLGARSEFAVLGLDAHVPGLSPVRIITTHLDWPLPPKVQERERQTLALLTRQNLGSNTLLAGDFNATPWSFGLRQLDGTLSPLRRLTGAWPTFPARQAGLTLPIELALLPIDQIYAAPNWRMSRLSRVRISGSDHYGLFASLHHNGTMRP